VTYSAPVLVLVLIRLAQSGVGKAEWAAVAVAALLFNRTIFSFGTQDGDLDTAIAFYGSYSHLLDGVTLWRLAEVTGWVLFGLGVRFVLGRNRMNILEFKRG
jgi:hypothetical protein